MPKGVAVSQIMINEVDPDVADKQDRRERQLDWGLSDQTEGMPT